jgi:hypothetical protein
LLLLGREEASYYEPQAASLEIRGLVVVGIRNSLLEDIACTCPYHPKLRGRKVTISDAEMPELTRDAIRFFAEADINEARLDRAVNHHGLFAGVAKKYPRAWQALVALSESTATGINELLSPVCSVASEPEEWKDGESAGLLTDVQSGIDPRISANLSRYLEMVRTGEIPLFFTDSFKCVSRNVEKLCRVIDAVLSFGATFVTHNYYIAPDRVAHRDPLLRPAHDNSDTLAKFSNLDGLAVIHKEALLQVRALMSEG